MRANLVGYPLVLIALVWVLLMLAWVWPSAPAAARPRPPTPVTPPRKRSTAPKPFPGLTRQPSCAACEQALEAPRLQPAPPPPPTVPSPRGRRRHVDTADHCCPDRDCRYGGWLGLGHSTSNGHPSGGPWRPLHCTGCGGSFPATHGTPLHGTRVAPDLRVWAMGALAEGLGIRAVARGFEVAPHTVLQGLVAGADQAGAFSPYVLHDVRVTQGQLDDRFALLSAVKAGEVSDAEAIQRLSRSPHWVWAAIDPVTKVLLTIDVGDRTLAMAQRVVHQVVQGLAPGWVPLFLPEGFKAYTTARLTHDGQWVQPARWRAQGPTPQPRWVPLPGRLSAQGVKTVRRRRLVRVQHRVVFGPLEAVQQVLAACGWQITTALIERLNLSIRQHGAAIGRRVTTLGKHEDGLRQQWALSHVYHHCCLPHARLRVPWPQPLPTNGTGSATTWRPRTPAMAAGLTERVWTLREGLRLRVPPWPQPVGV